MNDEIGSISLKWRRINGLIGLILCMPFISFIYMGITGRLTEENEWMQVVFLIGLPFVCIGFMLCATVFIKGDQDNTPW
jgi:hypothetical protein